MSFWAELKRRNVFRVGAAYAVGAWIVLQLLDVLGDILELPPWGGKLILVLVVIGFFMALVFAWAFELTPEGVKPEREVDRSQSISGETGQRLDRTIIVLLFLVVAWFLFDEFYLEPMEAARQTGGGDQAPAATISATNSIAVLPFEDLSQDQDQGWFADGLAEEILNSLTRIPELQVSSRTASFRYRDSDLPLVQIAGELGVGYVLEGSVRSSGDRIRVTAQLIRAADGFNLWSESYDRDAGGLISIQEDLARSIAEALEISLDPEALTEMSDAGTRSIEAYQAYLRGIALQGSPSTRPREEILREVRDLFEQAVAADPEFGEAWYRLADWWLQDLTLTNVFSAVSQVPVAVATDEFNRVINQAIEHATNRVDRDGYRAMKAEVAGRLREAVDLYAAFVAARPNQVLGWDGLMNAAMKASDTTRLRRAFDWLRENGRKDLRSATVYLAFAYQHEDPSEVADYGLARLEQWPEEPGLVYQVHRTMLWAGRIEEAAALARRLGDDFPNKPLLLLRQACAEGRTADAEAIFDDYQTEADAARRWLGLKILGRDPEATSAIAEMARSEFPQQYTTPLIYRIFDPTPFPAVMELLERENILRPPPLEIPYRCRPPQPPSIAVLPFANMSPDPDNEYFADGISEELLNLLARIEGLRVPSRTSSFAFKDQNLDIREIARQLEVNHVLEGSVRKAGAQVRITAQLIDVDTDTHLWSETFDRELEDIFAIQDEIAGHIVEQLQITLQTGSGADTEERRPTDNLEAYSLYLQGRQLFQRRGDSLLDAEAVLRQALELDPDFADAWATLALVKVTQTAYLASNSAENEAAALEAARRALALEVGSVDAQLALAQVDSARSRWSDALDRYAAIVDEHPQHALTRLWYAIALLTTGYTQEALRQTEAAVRLDPASAVVLDWHARALLIGGREDEIEPVVARALQLGRNMASLSLILRAEMLGDYGLFDPYRSEGRSIDRIIELLIEVENDPERFDEILASVDEEIERREASGEATRSLLYLRLNLLRAAGTPAQWFEQARAIGRFDDTIPFTLWAPTHTRFRRDPELKLWAEELGLTTLWHQRGWPDRCQPVSADDFECD